jgi:signal transduction histidine kinase
VVVTADGGQRVFRSMQPIENGPECAQCHDPDERLLGLLLTDISMAPMEAALDADLRENLLWWAGTILVTVLIVNLAVSRFVLRRLERLAGAIASFGGGELPPALPEGQPDEISQLAGAFSEMAQRVEARNAEVRKLSESVRRQSVQRGELLKGLITAQEDERKRVARELHDELGQSLGGLALQVEAIDRSVAPEAGGLRKQLERVHALVIETTDRMYDLILDLRPSALDDLGLEAALHTYAERVLADTEIGFELNADELTARLSAGVETTLYRCFQETLSNVVRHAGAKQVRITLAQRGAVFEGEIVDDGRGFDPERVRTDGREARGLGLLGIQERVTQCDGRVEIVSRPGSGTRIRIRVPLQEATYG